MGATAFVAAAVSGVWIENGHWAGSYREWRVSKRHVQLTSQHFARFRDRLEPYRPAFDTIPEVGDCKSHMSDAGGSVTWAWGNSVVKRVADFGCLDDRAMNNAVGSARAEVFGGEPPP